MKKSQHKKFDAQQKFQQLSTQEQQFEKLAANKISDLYAQNNMFTLCLSNKTIVAGNKKITIVK